MVVDLPRRIDAAVTEALAQVDMGLLLVPTELRAVAAAQRVAAGVQKVLGDLRIVARGASGRHGHGLPPDEIARLMELPLAGEVPWEDGLLADLSRGVPPGAQVRRPLARFCTAFWERLTESGADGGGPASVTGTGPGESTGSGAGVREPAVGRGGGQA